MQTKKPKGSFTLRVMIFGFSAAVGVLAFWLLGYVLRDIDRVQGPNYNQMLEEGLPPDLQDLRTSLASQLDKLQRQIQSLQERRSLTASATRDSQQTINQLLDLKRNAEENQTPLNEEQQQALTENLELFLANQRQTQQLNTDLSTLNEQLESVKNQQRANDTAIQEASKPIIAQYEREYTLHQWQLAAYKLALLIPLLLVFGWMFVRHAGGTYSMLVYALSGAVALRVILVMHEHFPAIYFRYILIILSLVIAITVLVRLLRLLARPSRDWLLKQYREAYASFLCPVCDYPIQRGPLKFANWTRRSLKKYSLRTATLASDVFEAPYTCPCCSTTLFENCQKCGGVRHSLLPACEKCGSEKQEA